MPKKRNKKVDFEHRETKHFHFLKIFFKIKNCDKFKRLTNCWNFLSEFLANKVCKQKNSTTKPQWPS